METYYPWLGMILFLHTATLHTPWPCSSLRFPLSCSSLRFPWPCSSLCFPWPCSSLCFPHTVYIPASYLAQALSRLDSLSPTKPTFSSTFLHSGCLGPAHVFVVVVFLSFWSACWSRLPTTPAVAFMCVSESMTWELVRSSCSDLRAGTWSRCWVATHKRK